MYLSLIFIDNYLKNQYYNKFDKKKILMYIITVLKQSTVILMR